ncbi:hypothetical protein EON63_02535 [archaeon]|nr:MAG: hypothetical protein EON63_02535 [archaeon]
MRSGDIRICGYDRKESLMNAQFFLDVNYSFPTGVANSEVVYTPTDKVNGDGVYDFGDICVHMCMYIWSYIIFISAIVSHTIHRTPYTIRHITYTMHHLPHNNSRDSSSSATSTCKTSARVCRTYH